MKRHLLMCCIGLALSQAYAERIHAPQSVGQCDSMFQSRGGNSTCQTERHNGKDSESLGSDEEILNRFPELKQRGKTATVHIGATVIDKNIVNGNVVVSGQNKTETDLRNYNMMSVDSNKQYTPEYQVRINKQTGEKVIFRNQSTDNVQDSTYIEQDHDAPITAKYEKTCDAYSFTYYDIEACPTGSKVADSFKYTEKQGSVSNPTIPSAVRPDGSKGYYSGISDWKYETGHSYYHFFNQIVPFDKPQYNYPHWTGGYSINANSNGRLSDYTYSGYTLISNGGTRRRVTLTGSPNISVFGVESEIREACKRSIQINNPATFSRPKYEYGQTSCGVACPTHADEGEVRVLKEACSARNRRLSQASAEDQKIYAGEEFIVKYISSDLSTVDSTPEGQGGYAITKFTKKYPFKYGLGTYKHPKHGIKSACDVFQEVQVEEATCVVDGRHTQLLALKRKEYEAAKVQAPSTPSTGTTVSTGGGSGSSGGSTTKPDTDEIRDTGTVVNRAPTALEANNIANYILNGKRVSFYTDIERRDRFLASGDAEAEAWLFSWDAAKQQRKYYSFDDLINQGYAPAY